MNLRDELNAARATVARLEQQAKNAACAEIGHRWKFTGCCACCCDDTGECSLPVHECTVCGDCDYGENDDAANVKADCSACA